MDDSKMNRAEYQEGGEFFGVCTTLRDAGEILHTADRVPDETTKAPLIDGAKRMLQNALDALNGRRTDGMVEPEEDD
jgi:hypothetical protein